MILAVGPYHLTTREPPALAAFLLGARVVTLAPGPEGRSREAHALARSLPAYLGAIKSWEWTKPLWDAGVLAGLHSGESPVQDMLDVVRDIDERDDLLPLRAVTSPEAFADPRVLLQALGADLLKGGPNPSLSIPVLAGLDRFAARHGLMAVRPAPTSLAQRAEATLARPIFSTAVPVLVQADADRVLIAREALEEPLLALRESIDRCVHAGLVGNPDPGAPRVESAAISYARAFEAAQEDFLRGAADDDVRAVVATATLSASILPGDAVLRAAVLALESFTARVPVTTPPAPGATASALAASRAPRPFAALTIKPLGMRT